MLQTGAVLSSLEQLVYYSQGKKKNQKLRHFMRSGGKEKVSRTLASKGFQSMHSVSQKLNSKENITIQICCLTVGQPATC